MILYLIKVAMSLKVLPEYHFELSVNDRLNLEDVTSDCGLFYVRS